MGVGPSPYLVSGWLATVGNNSPLVVPITCIQLHLDDPDDGTGNLSAVTDRMAATFDAPVIVGNSVSIASSGEPPSWFMTAAEVIKFISVHDAFEDGNWLWNARLNQPQTLAEGDTFRLGGGLSLTITGVAI